MDGVALTLSYLRVGIVGAGYTFNLRERELETLLEARSANTAADVLRGDGAAGELPGSHRGTERSRLYGIFM
jgi:hypothetical protein